MSGGELQHCFKQRVWISGARPGEEEVFEFTLIQVKVVLHQQSQKFKTNMRKVLAVLYTEISCSNATNVEKYIMEI